MGQASPEGNSFRYEPISKIKAGRRNAGQGRFSQLIRPVGNGKKTGYCFKQGLEVKYTIKNKLGNRHVWRGGLAQGRGFAQRLFNCRQSIALKKQQRSSRSRRDGSNKKRVIAFSRKGNG